MAVTVTANLTDVTLAENATGLTGGGTWGTAGTALATGDGVFKQGTDSQSEKVTKNNTGWLQWIGTAQDMSATDTHLYWWLLTSIRPNMTAMEIRIGDGAGAYTGWTIDAFTEWDGSWKCFVQNLAATADFTSGTIDLTDITTIGVLYSTVGANFRAIENCWVDALRFGTGLTATGTAFDLADIAAVDQLVANQYGILENIDDVIFSQGRLQIGNGATTTTFTSDNEVLVFRDAAVSSTLYDFELTGSGCEVVISSLTARAAGTTDNARFVCDFSVANSLTITGSAFTRTGLLTLAAGHSVINTVFNGCSQVDPSTATFNNNTFSNYVGTLGAVLFPSNDSNISDLVFIVCDNGVEYDASSDSTLPSFDNFTFDDEAGNFDVNNTSGAVVSIGNANGSNGNSYNTGGDIVTFLSNPVSLTIKVQDTDGVAIQDARVLTEAGVGGAYPIDVVVSITRVTTVATVTQTAHGLANGDKVVIRNAGENEYIGVHTISNVTLNTYDYTVAGSPTTPATGTILSTFVLLEGLTDVSGEITISRTYASNTPLSSKSKVRKSTISPFYKTGSVLGTVDKDTGLVTTVVMLSDE